MHNTTLNSDEINMINFLKNKVLGQIISLTLLIVLKFLKLLFWFIFVCLFLLQTIIIINIFNDLPTETEYAYCAVIVYILLTSCFAITLFIHKKLFVYISAFGILILFLYLSSLPSLSMYFGYFDSLD